MLLEPNKRDVVSLDFDTDLPKENGFVKIIDGVFKTADSRWFSIRGKLYNCTGYPINKVYLDILVDNAHHLKWFVCDTIPEKSEKKIVIDTDCLTRFGYALNHISNLENIKVELSFLSQNYSTQIVYTPVEVVPLNYKWTKIDAGT